MERKRHEEAQLAYVERSTLYVVDHETEMLSDIPTEKEQRIEWIKEHATLIRVLDWETGKEESRRSST